MKKRIKIVQFRASESEFRAIKNQAKKEHYVSLSEFLRKLALDQSHYVELNITKKGES